MHKDFIIRTSQVPRSLRRFLPSFLYASVLQLLNMQAASALPKAKCWKKEPPTKYQGGFTEEKKGEDETHDDDIQVPTTSS